MSNSKGFIADNWFKLFFVFVTILVIGIYFHRESQLDACLANADLGYQGNWESQCKIAKKESDCLLMGVIADKIAKTRETDANGCINRYKLFR